MTFSCARNFVMVAMVSLALAGCFEEDIQANEPPHSVEWFKKHDAERQVTLEECADNPGELRGTPNCENALEAETQLSSGSLRQVDNW